MESCSSAASGGASGPLSGLRVVDLSRLVAGNMLSMQLADFGADVIKVESAREGDTLRHWREDLDDGGSLDAWWQVYGRNKKSLALDLRDRDAIGIMRKILAGAQVLIESFRPGTLESMGLAPAALHAFNPRLVIVRISGWGQTGPYRDLPGFGSLLEGFCGFAYKHAVDDVPRLPNLALADMVAGLAGAFATVAAVREVEARGGQGQVIDLSLLEPMLAIMGPDVTAYAATGRVAGPSVKIASPRGVYRCKDGGWVALSGSTDTMARRVLEAIGRGELADEPRFATNAARLANDAELEAILAEAIGQMDQDACLAHLRAKGVTAGPIYNAAELAADRHVMERACYVAPAQAGGTLMQNVMPRLSNTPGLIREAAPLLGQHSAQVLREAGVDDAQIGEMAARGAIKCI